MSRFPSQFNLYDIFNVMVFPVGGCAIVLALDWADKGQPVLLQSLRDDISTFFIAELETTESNGAVKKTQSAFPGSTLLGAGFGFLAFVAAYILGNIAGAVTDIIRLNTGLSLVRQRAVFTSEEWLADKTKSYLENAQLIDNVDGNRQLRRHDNRLWAAFFAIPEEWRFEQADRFNALSIAMFNLFVLFSLGLIAAACMQANANVTAWKWTAPLLTSVGVAALAFSHAYFVDRKPYLFATAIISATIMFASLPWDWSQLAWSKPYPLPAWNNLASFSAFLVVAALLCIFRWRFFVRVFIDRVFRMYIVDAGPTQKSDVRVTCTGTGGIVETSGRVSVETIIGQANIVSRTSVEPTPGDDV